MIVKKTFQVEEFIDAIARREELVFNRAGYGEVHAKWSGAGPDSTDRVYMLSLNTKVVAMVIVAEDGEEKQVSVVKRWHEPPNGRRIMAIIRETLGVPEDDSF